MHNLQVIVVVVVIVAALCWNPRPYACCCLRIPSTYITSDIVHLFVILPSWGNEGSTEHSTARALHRSCTELLELECGWDAHLHVSICMGSLFISRSEWLHCCCCSGPGHRQVRWGRSGAGISEGESPSHNRPECQRRESWVTETSPDPRVEKQHKVVPTRTGAKVQGGDPGARHTETGGCQLRMASRPLGSSRSPIGETESQGVSGSKTLPQRGRCSSFLPSVLTEHPFQSLSSVFNNTQAVTNCPHHNAEQTSSTLFSSLPKSLSSFMNLSPVLCLHSSAPGNFAAACCFDEIDFFRFHDE
ncbi:PREDICTED: uncharacterized protein LOC102013213 [Chinchilla lanigera]|uniref:uncharacterized protein LOC102013213 n=1 Tax=Chinchilla lanigera TaxID=34839 RepID=UPI00038ED18F|nr:PREDICTED: uncharacterized protein LOC102013213 [Chinchilla lanigera]